MFTSLGLKPLVVAAALMGISALLEGLQRFTVQTPVILITAYPSENHRKRALDNGAVGFLSKPFEEEALIECLNAAIKLQVAQAL